jgi:hypothetical protein
MSDSNAKVSHSEMSIRSVKSFTVRLRPPLRNYLQEAANQNCNGSLQQEIIRRLVESINADPAEHAAAGTERTAPRPARSGSAISH